MHRVIRLADDDRVRRHRAADDALAEPPARVDHDLAAVARDRVGAEDDRRDVRRDEALHEHREADPLGGQSLLATVLQGPIRVGRFPAALDGLDDRLRAGDIEEGVVLPGEGGRPAVLVHRRGADRDGWRRAAASGEPVVRVRHALFHGCGESARVVRRLARRFARGEGGRREAVAGRDVVRSGEPAEIRDLAADKGAVHACQITEPENLHGLPFHDSITRRS